MEQGFVIFESLLVVVLLGFLMGGAIRFYQQYEHALWGLLPR